jgi:hypothetical protein
MFETNPSDYARDQTDQDQSRGYEKHLLRDSHD